MFVRVHAADIQDRDGTPDVLRAIRFRFAWLRHVFAHGGYAGDNLRDALEGQGDWTLEIIKRSNTAKGLVLLPRGWLAKRTFAWLGRCRRLAKDWERFIDSSAAWATVVRIGMLSTGEDAQWCENNGPFGTSGSFGGNGLAGSLRKSATSARIASTLAIK